MTKVTCTYNISNFNFSLITKHPINDDVIIKQLVEDGYFSTFQCPDDLSYLVNKFTIDQINTTLSTLSSLTYSSLRQMNHIIETIVLNEFPNGISVYSKTQMKLTLELFNQISFHKITNRKKLAKLIRDSNNLIHSGRGMYIHASNLLFICHQKEKATNELLIALELLVKKQMQMDGQKAFENLQQLCNNLNLSNQYALYGFVQCFKPKSFFYSQDRIGIITYQQKTHNRAN